MFRLLMLLPLCALAGALSAMFANPPQTSAAQMSVAEYSGNTIVAYMQDNDAAAFGRVFPPTETGSTTSWLRIVISAGSFGGMLYMTTPALTTGGSDFAVDTTGFNTGGVNPGNATEFLVAFNPQSVGSFGGTIQYDYEPDHFLQPGVWSTFTINISGQGVGSPTAWLSVREGSSTGDRVFIGQTGLGGRDLGERVTTSGPGNSVTICLTNEGSSGAASINLGAPAFTSGGSDYVLDTAGFSYSLAAGVSTSFTVTFAPASLGNLPATLEFTHSDTNTTSPFSIDFVGVGTDRPAQMLVTDQPGNLWVTGGGFVPFYTGTPLTENEAATGNRDFGNVTTNASQVIQIDNGDAGWLDINMIYHAGNDLTLGTPIVIGDADFTVDLTGYSTNVASAGTTSFTIKFNPQVNGVRSAVIEIPHGDSSERTPFRINVTGFGVNVGSGGKSGGGDSGGGCAAVGGGSAIWLLLAVLGGMVLVPRLRRAG